MESTRDRFRRLVAPVHERVRAFARGLCRSQADGDDLFQEASLRAFSRLDGLREDGAFRTWFYRIVISVHRNRARTAFWRRLVPLGERAAEADYREPAPDAGDATRRARAALAVLPTVQREAIVLFEIDGWKVEEIAALQRVSASAVKSRLARGRERLRVYYEKQLGATTPVEST